MNNTTGTVDNSLGVNVNVFNVLILSHAAKVVTQIKMKFIVTEALRRVP